MSNRDRFRVLSGVHAELEAAGVVIDIGQIDWICRTVEQRLNEQSLDRQFAREQERRQVASDQQVEDEQRERRDRFAFEGEVETPLGQQIEGE